MINQIIQSVYQKEKVGINTPVAKVNSCFNKKILFKNDLCLLLQTWKTIENYVQKQYCWILNNFLKDVYGLHAPVTELCFNIGSRRSCTSACPFLHQVQSFEGSWKMWNSIYRHSSEIFILLFNNKAQTGLDSPCSQHCCSSCGHLGRKHISIVSLYVGFKITGESEKHYGLESHVPQSQSAHGYFSY